MAKRSPQRTDCADQLMFDLRVKWCSRCELERPAWDFAKNKARKDGLQTYCRTCWNIKQGEYYENSEVYRQKRKARSAESYQRNRTEVRARHKAWARANVEDVRRRSAAWHAANRDKVRARHKAWREANPELARQRSRRYYDANIDKIREQSKAWRRANADRIREVNRAWVEANRAAHNAKGARRRARESEVPTAVFTAEDLAQRWAYYGNRCWICHKPATATDHVKPISKGGGHMLCNLRPICKSCNSSKGAKWPYVPPQRINAA